MARYIGRNYEDFGRKIQENKGIIVADWIEEIGSVSAGMMRE